jgi:hypothetical protein
LHSNTRAGDGHSIHSDNPEIGEYLPSGHEEHSKLKLYVPGSQLLQDVGEFHPFPSEQRLQVDIDG